MGYYLRLVGILLVGLGAKSKHGTALVHGWGLKE